MEALLGFVAILCFGFLGIACLKEQIERNKWKKKENRERWRKIRSAMTQQQVRSILGEPRSIQVENASTLWSFERGGFAKFQEQNLIAWKEP